MVGEHKRKAVNFREKSLVPCLFQLVQIPRHRPEHRLSALHNMAGNMSGAKPEGIIGMAGGMLGAGAGRQHEKRAGERSGALWLSEKSGRKEAGFQPEKKSP